MRNPAQLRPELASICRYVAKTRVVRPGRGGMPQAPLHGILADLAAMRGL